MKRTRLRPRRSTRRRSSRVYDTPYLLWVKTLECSARELGLSSGYPCGGVVEADHMGSRGLGQKCSDRLAAPICSNHHRERTDFSGAFKLFRKAEMRAWLADAIAQTQALWVAQQGRAA